MAGSVLRFAFMHHPALPCKTTMQRLRLAACRLPASPCQYYTIIHLLLHLFMKTKTTLLYEFAVLGSNAGHTCYIHIIVK